MEKEIYKQPNELDNALKVASYFGFIPIKTPQITKDDIEVAKKHCDEHPYYDAAEKASLVRTYIEENMASHPHPLALAHKKHASRKKFGTHSLHFIGSESGIAEATLIRTALSILSEEGFSNMKVDINCIGDKESIQTYERELSSYIRKSDFDINDELREKLKKDIFCVLRMEDAGLVELCENAPSSITFLSVASRIYFKEVLEYIEALGIEFSLVSNLVGEKNHASHTIFAIRNQDEESGDALAVGYRYSRIARFMGSRKDTPMAGVSIFGKTGKESVPTKNTTREMPKPKFSLVQLGREAKMRALSLIELLRTHKIPLHHSIGKDKITSQLSGAEALGVSHLIIIGQKEALDGTVTVRNISTRAQETVLMDALPKYLKTIKL